MTKSLILKILLWASWMASGVFLFYKGAFNLSLIKTTPVLQVVLLFSAYILGELKARFVLAKSVKRDPSSMDFLIILLMGLMGMFLAKYNMNLFVKVFVELAVGYALLRGSSFRLRHFFSR